MENRDSTIELPLENAGIEKAANEKKKNSVLSRLKFVPLILLVFVSGGIVGMYFQPPTLQAFFNTTGLEPGGGTSTPLAVAVQKVSDKEEVAIVSEGDIVALGKIVPRGEIVTVSPPFGAGDARVNELKAIVGDEVSAGQVLAILDSLRSFEGNLLTAEANVEVAKATLNQTKFSVEVGRKEAQASLERAIATEQSASDALRRIEALAKTGVATKAELDAATTRAAEAQRDVERARATLSRYQNGEDGNQADIAVAEANLLAANAKLEQAKIDIEKAYVKAPITGTVLDVHTNLGERPGTEGIIDLGDISQMTVEAEVYQSLVGRVSIGDHVILTADAIEGELLGEVSAIGLEIGRQSITSDDPAANTDARVVDVIITLDPASSAKAQRFTNLQVVARIDGGQKAQ